MNQRKLVAVALLTIASVALWRLKVPQASHSQKTLSPAERTPAPTSQAVATPILSQSLQEQRNATAEKVRGVLSTPIEFYGKVVDQNAEPVPDATVNYNALDRFDAPGTQYQGKSHVDGSFSIGGIGGAALSVGVRKEGYYMIDGKSANTFAYGIGPDSARRQPPTRDNPAIFVLQRMGMTEPLIHISSRTYRIPRNGTPIEVNLTTGRISSDGHLRVEAWTEDQVKDAKQHYNWRCRISVPSGGLLEREGQFDFQAPADGYKPSDDIVMLRTAEKWQPQAKRHYFIQLPDGKYARLGFYMIAQGDHFFEIESYLNPSAGSRNLEFDPKKAINSPLLPSP